MHVQANVVSHDQSLASMYRIVKGINCSNTYLAVFLSHHIKHTPFQIGHYAISVTQPKGMDHMLILPTFADDPAAPGLTRYRLGTHSRDLFNTIPKLIAYYIDHE